MREVRRLCDNGYQTAVLTTRRDLPRAVVARRMFERWTQENFFRYLRQHFALDALVSYAVEPAEIVRLAPEAKHLTDTIKLLAFRAETALVRALASHYAKTEDDGRALVREILLSSADLLPQPETGQLRVRLHSLANPRSDAAVAHLCQTLNALEVRYPGTTLTLVCEPPRAA